MDYGNYLDGIANGVAASVISKITALTVTWGFSLTETSTGAANEVIDLFTFTTSAGTTASIGNEIEIYTDPSPGALEFINGNGLVGTYISAASNRTPSLRWKVTYQASNYNNAPYYQFSLPRGNTLHAGTFDLLAAMNWLKTQFVPGQSVNRCLTGAEFFTGFGIGYEELGYTTTMSVNSISAVYTHN